jgi:hypothetical protein
LATFFFYGRHVASISKQQRRLGARNRADAGRVGPGLRQEFFNHDATAGFLCFYLRSEGTDGRSRCTGLKNNQDQPGLKSVD